MKYFPDVIIVGDDYLYWSGVKKAVHQIRFEYTIPYLDIDKNCFALVHENDKNLFLPVETYNNDSISINLQKYKKITGQPNSKEEYKYEEIKYALTTPSKKKFKRCFIIIINKTEDAKSLIYINKTDIIVFIKTESKKHPFLLYNIAYLYFKNKNKNYNKYFFYFINNNNLINNFINSKKDNLQVKTLDGIVSVQEYADMSIDVYSDLGIIGMSSNIFEKIEGFPYRNVRKGGYKKYHTINYLYRYFLFP